VPYRVELPPDDDIERAKIRVFDVKVVEVELEVLN
jgi:hypothetical protein